MRHGEAGEADSRRWPDDRQRPLTDAGRVEHARVAEALRRMGVRFDRLLSSPLARARETAEITARVYGAPAPELTELLGDRRRAGLARSRGWPRSRPPRLLCVGHEPTLSRLAGLLISRDGSARVEMAKSGVAVIDCPGPVAPGRGVLRLHLRPPELIALLDGGPAAAAAPSPDPFLEHHDRVPAQRRAQGRARPGPVHRHRGGRGHGAGAGRALRGLAPRHAHPLRLPHRGRPAPRRTATPTR